MASYGSMTAFFAGDQEHIQRLVSTLHDLDVPDVDHAPEMHGRTRIFLQKSNNAALYNTQTL